MKLKERKVKKINHLQNDLEEKGDVFDECLDCSLHFQLPL